MDFSSKHFIVNLTLCIFSLKIRLSICTSCRFLRNFYSSRYLFLPTGVEIDGPISSSNLFHIFLLRSYSDNNSSGLNPDGRRGLHESFSAHAVKLFPSCAESLQRDDEVKSSRVCKFIWDVFILAFPFRINFTLFWISLCFSVCSSSIFSPSFHQSVA